MALQRPDSEDGVANLVLGKCKEDEIATLDDELNRARVVRRYFPLVRDALLRRHDWNFASTWCRPAADAVAGAGLFLYHFPMPEDCLAIRFVEDLEEDEWEGATARVTIGGVEVEAQILATDAIAPHVRYTRRVETVRLWDPLFMAAFVGLCAADCAPLIGRSTREATRYRDEAEALLAPLAQRADSKEKAKSKVAHNKLNPWLAARFGIRRSPF